MKIVCTQENLKNGVYAAGKVVSTTNTLPILNNLLLKTEAGQFKIFSTNLEMAVIATARCKIEEEGETTVTAKTLMELVNNLPNKNISLQVKNKELHLETENFHTTIKTLPAEEFPLIPKVESSERAGVPGQELKKAIDQVAFAASSNQTQPEISGVFMGFNSDLMTITATDRYRLAERKIKILKNSIPQREIIIPNKTIQEISRTISTYNGEVEVVLTENQISFLIDQTQIISRLVDGQYPPYQQIIPENYNTEILTGKTDLINALKAGGVFSQSSHSVKLEYSSQKQNLIITSESQELGKSLVEIPSQIKGEEGVLLFNHRYVLDCLNSISEEKVVIKIVNDNSPTVIKPENNPDYVYLVMPIKT